MSLIVRPTHSCGVAFLLRDDLGRVALAKRGWPAGVAHWRWRWPVCGAHVDDDGSMIRRFASGSGLSFLFSIVFGLRRIGFGYCLAFYASQDRADFFPHIVKTFLDCEDRLVDFAGDL